MIKPSIQHASSLIDHQHASEIAFMSLDLLAGVSTFCIPHRPFEKIKIRVGVNSGSCVAGKYHVDESVKRVSNKLNLFTSRRCWNEYASLLLVWYVKIVDIYILIPQQQVFEYYKYISMPADYIFV